MYGLNSVNRKATWVKFDPALDVNQLRERAMQEGLLLPKSVYLGPDKQHLNAIRMGFASLNTDEMKEAMQRLTKSL